MLKESEAGAQTDDICRRHGISSATFFSWRKTYGGMDASEAKRPRELKAENAIGSGEQANGDTHGKAQSRGVSHE